MDFVYALGHAGAIAFSLSLAFAGFMIVAGAQDVPVIRSSHVNRTPTSGGIGLTAGIGGAVLCFGLFYPYFLDGPLTAKLLSIALGLCLLGLADDVYSAHSGFKMFLIAVLSALAVWAIGPVTALPVAAADINMPIWLGFIGSALWVFVVINAVNFTDGANGMMGVSLSLATLMLTGLALLAGAQNTAILSSALAASLIGFLPYNFRKSAKIFSGDVGSLVAGFIFASAALMLVKEAPQYRLLYAGPILILPLLTDVFLTLIRRARRKENLMSAHNQHLYQRLIQSGWSHPKTAAVYGLAGLFCGVIAIFTLAAGQLHSMALLALWVGIASVIYTLAIQRLKRKTNELG